MTDRLLGGRAALVAIALVAALVLAGCGDDAPDTAADPSPSPSTSEESSAEPSPSESNDVPAGDEPCDAVDIEALGTIAGVTFDTAEPYEEGANMADGCFVSTATGEVSVAIDIRTRHGSLEKDVKLAQLQGNEEPQPLTVADGDALFVAGSSSPLAYTGLVTHVGDLLVLVNVLSQGADVSDDQLRELTVAAAEMVAPVI